MEKDQKKIPLTLAEISESAKKRVALIGQEFKSGFEFVNNYPRSVTFFGSARTKENDLYYEKAKTLAMRIVGELHYSVVTGGGPGIMEAANRGAYEMGGNSLGLTIQLPHEQVTNQYLTDQLGFHYFFSRKVCLAFSAEAYVFFPGGFGTMDEFTEILTLVQTRKIPQAPIILFGKEYWQILENFFKEKLLKAGLIDEEDLSIYTITDSESEALTLIKNAPIRFGLKYDERSEEAVKNNNNHHINDTISALSEKHCYPCEGDTPPLSHEASIDMLKVVQGWTLVEDKEIEKVYEFKNFTEAAQFVDEVARLAEAEGHHPEIKLFEFKKVNIRISTHAIDGLSENNFILASKIDDILRDKS